MGIEEVKKGTNPRLKQEAGSQTYIPLTSCQHSAQTPKVSTTTLGMTLYNPARYNNAASPTDRTSCPFGGQNTCKIQPRWVTKKPLLWDEIPAPAEDTPVTTTAKRISTTTRSLPSPAVCKGSHCSPGLGTSAWASASGLLLTHPGALFPALSQAADQVETIGLLSEEEEEEKI